MLSLLLRKNTHFILATIINTVKFFLHEEWKNKQAFIGIMVYIFSAVLITFLAIPGIDKPLFSALFWIVVVFTTLQGISKSFIGLRKGNFAYWQQLVSPETFLAAKLITAFLMMFLYTLLSFLIFLIIHGNIADNALLFCLVAMFVGTGISFVFTISSSIAAKTDSAGMLLPVLSFPLNIPFLLIGIKASKKAVDGLPLNLIIPDLLLLLGLNILILILGIYLIKFIWKD